MIKAAIWQVKVENHMEKGSIHNDETSASNWDDCLSDWTPDRPLDWTR